MYTLSHRDTALLCQRFLSLTRFCCASYIRKLCASRATAVNQMHSEFRSDYVICRPRGAHIEKRLLCLSVNTMNANEKQKALKQKKEAKKMARLERQRLNELKSNVCILCVVLDVVLGEIILSILLDTRCSPGKTTGISVV